MVALASLGALALLLLSGLSCCSEACMEPQITPSYYTTSDAVISTETVFIVEISLTCKNRVQATGGQHSGASANSHIGEKMTPPLSSPQNMALYADVSGKQFPVTRGQDVGRYQVSWSLDHKNAHAGTYEVRFFDEESYSQLRKAQRNNEDISSIAPLFTVSVDHRVSGLKRLAWAWETGTWNGPWVSTEVLAAVIGIVIYYLAFNAKSHIQA
ncbi:translocon-associated protein subunit delta isoform X2 [Pipistrellus kuhlii]|uniref:Translocon-associated protein subunit delta n=1 Tax=Pipistrellus kuhlii TaxID=59472 RepID=A0A7J7R4F4_PIPKU|nr:translocon-associated protein subunit delta isoform X2 [Pipistrellus kuhlii]KAF6270984.1 signal sequence receptor subunit 4 [Pipistrellus kuhlii]